MSFLLLISSPVYLPEEVPVGCAQGTISVRTTGKDLIHEFYGKYTGKDANK